MRITALEPQRHDRDRVNLYADGEFRCGLALEVARRCGFSVGASVDDAALRRAEAEDARWRAREAAFTLLAYRPRTESELRNRLLRKGVAPDVTDQVLAELREKGYVDDSAFAESFVRDRLRLRPRGRRRLLQELRAKGVDRETAEPAVAKVMAEEGISEREMARRVADRWTRANPGLLEQAEDRRKPRRRLYGHLARRGFSADVVHEIIDDVLSEE